MSAPTQLPPGQFALDEFPRFGLPPFAGFFPKETRPISLKIRGHIEAPITVTDVLHDLPRVDQTSDLHCVTTWTRQSLHWTGFRFSDFYERIVLPQARPRQAARFVMLRCQDGYATSLLLEDLLAEDVIFAERLNGEPLQLEHGAPLRLVTPAHYGYKNAKHVYAVEFWQNDRLYRPAAFRFLDHPRARVALEERGRGVPGRLLRYVYRPLIRPTIRHFRRALQRHADGRPDRSST